MRINSLKIFLLCFAYSFMYCSETKAICNINLKDIPKPICNYISSLQIEELGPYKPTVSIESISPNMVKVYLVFEIADTLRQDDWHLNITPGFKPDFHWAPHLTPTNEHIISDHVFRSPALIVSGEGKQLTILPDLAILQKRSPVNWYMDLDAVNNKLTLGLSKYKVREHVLFVRDNGAVYPPGKLEFGFYIMVSNQSKDIADPFRKILSFYWTNWGKPLYDSGVPTNGSLVPYVEHAYQWALYNWKNTVWQEFELNDKTVGAPVFIVNITQSPNYKGEINEREFRSVWNQAWFSSLRSAQGLYRYARRKNNSELLDYALKTKELALSFPQNNGFFPGLIATKMQNIEIDGKEYNRSKGWNEYYFGNSNRNPLTWNAADSPFHILDMSWTCYLMLTWYEELEKDSRLLSYAEKYAASLIKIQSSNGFFPAWLTVNELIPLKELKESPETSMSVTFLLELYKLNKDEKYFEAAIKAMNAVIENIIPVGKWEDFETYWSCSRYGEDILVGKKVVRNDMFKQNNFSMYWTAEALLNTYEVTKEEKYLKLGQRVLDELLMTQASWQPPYMFVNTLGGFGVMNADGEWNDSRQSLFSELIIRYGKILGEQEYVERGIAALRASFVMMYCPENLKTKQQWEKKYNFFGEEDYGFMMENYGHEGYTNSEGLGIGEFTIYDWGNGAAAEAYNRILDHLGKEFLGANSSDK